MYIKLAEKIKLETSYAILLEDDNLIKVLKEFEVFTNKGKPLYLCDYTRVNNW